MTISNEKNIRVLKDLIETCRDGEHGYAHAAKEAKDPELARVFSQYATQRTQYIAELQQLLRSYGSEPVKHGSIGGSLHRGWIDLKAALSRNEPHAVLAECERGEDAAVANYRTALTEAELDMETRAVVQRQAAGVKEAHDRIKQLRDSVTYAHR